MLRRKRDDADLDSSQTVTQWNVQKKAVQPENERATLCLSHVRALNSQFARWVQQQLAEHPNELWREGVKDYLKHADKVLDDFKDVVAAIEHAKQSSGPPPTTAFSQPNPSVPKYPATQPLTSLYSNHSKPGPNQASAFPNLFAATAPITACTNSSTVTASPTVAFPTATESTKAAPNFSIAAPAALGTGPGEAVVPGVVPGVKQGFVFGSGSPAEMPVWKAPPPLMLFSSGTTSSLSPARPPMLFGTGFGALGSDPLKGVGGSGDTARKDAADEDGAAGDEEKEPDSPSLRATQAEEGITVAFSSTVKVQMRNEKVEGQEKFTWKDLGKGDLSIRRKEAEQIGTKASQPQITFRNSAGKLLLNAQLFAKIDPVLRKGGCIIISLVAVSPADPPAGAGAGAEELPGATDGGQADANGKAAATSVAEPKLRMYLIKLASDEQANEFRDIILSNAPKD